MLSEHERRQLAEIERHLASADPDFAQRLVTGTSGSWSGVAVALGIGLPNPKAWVRDDARGRSWLDRGHGGD